MRGLYAITPQRICANEDTLVGAVEQALRGGASMIQYRDKWNPPSMRARNATSLLQLCRDHAARLIINDDVALAASIGADGVHLGANDAEPARARAQLGTAAIIGITCGNSLERAETALKMGADYLAFGRFWPSLTKPDAPQAALELLPLARKQFPGTPICAIGGITPQNAEPLIAAGADLLAAVEGVFGASDIAAAAREYRRLFDVIPVPCSIQ